MTTKIIAMVVAELAIGVVFGFAAWSVVSPKLIAAVPPSV